MRSDHGGNALGSGISGVARTRASGMVRADKARDRGAVGWRQAVGHAALGRRGPHASSLVGGSWSVAPLSRWRKEIMGRQRRRRELACVRYNRGHCAQQRHPVDGKRPQYHRSPLGHSTRGQVRSSGRQRRGKHGLRPCNKHGLWSDIARQNRPLIARRPGGGGPCTRRYGSEPKPKDNARRRRPPDQPAPERPWCQANTSSLAFSR